MDTIIKTKKESVNEDLGTSRTLIYHWQEYTFVNHLEKNLVVCFKIKHTNNI